jgi:hypothetical protein
LIRNGVAEQVGESIKIGSWDYFSGDKEDFFRKAVIAKAYLNL